MEEIRRITGSLVEPNRHVRSLEETRQIVGFLLRFRSRFLVEGRKHLDVHTKFARLALIRPRPGDPTIHKDDPIEPSLLLVHLFVEVSVNEVVTVPMSDEEGVEAWQSPYSSGHGRPLLQGRW